MLTIIPLTVFTDFATSEEESSEGSFDLDSCSYCGRACTAMARSFESKKFCSNTCARLFGIPVPKRGSYSGSGIGGRGRGGWKHYLNRKNVTPPRKLSRVSCRPCLIEKILKQKHQLSYQFSIWYCSLSTSSKSCTHYLNYTIRFDVFNKGTSPGTLAHTLRNVESVGIVQVV
jgi:hypothetical protein